MDPVIRGVCPIESSAIVRYMMRVARKRRVLDEGVERCVERLVPLLPSNYLPDVCLTYSLVGQSHGHPYAALALDSYDYHYLSSVSDDASPIWSADEVGASIPEPEQNGDFVGLVASAGGIRPFSWAADGNDACAYVPAGLEEARTCLSRMGMHVQISGGDGRFELLAVSPRAGIQASLANNPHRDELLGFLRQLGADEARVSALGKAAGRFGVPYYDRATGYQELIVLLDVSHLSLVWEHGGLVEAHAGILISDKIMGYAGRSLKPGRAYQWHITEECDQRCKHCYIFGEDARKACVSTPWEQLVATLDQVQARCAASHGYPTLAISGGDPLLHPQFWDFAEELHRRGISWTAMGNPFHLDLEACRRLRRLGCFQYQMSLDGLEEFHDRLRKPGSYRATLAALAPLQEAGVETQLMATASRQNLDDILACMDVAACHGVSSFSFARYCATSPEKARELYPTPEEYRAFLLAYWEKKRDYERTGCRTVFKTKEHLFTLLRWELGDFELPSWSGKRPPALYGGCHLGSKATICANGDLVACRRMPSVVGNICHDSLWDVEHGEAMRHYAEVDGIEKCRDCELLLWCRGCRAVGVNATGNLQAADPMCWK